MDEVMMLFNQPLPPVRNEAAEFLMSPSPPWEPSSKPEEMAAALVLIPTNSSSTSLSLLSSSSLPPLSSTWGSTVSSASPWTTCSYPWRCSSRPSPWAPPPPGPPFLTPGGVLHVRNAAVVLLITSSISPSLRWVPFAVSLPILLFLGCFKLFPAILHYVAALGRWRFLVFLIGPAADDVDMQPSNNLLSPTSMDHEQRVHLHGEISETAAPADQL